MLQEVAICPARKWRQLPLPVPLLLLPLLLLPLTAASGCIAAPLWVSRVQHRVKIQCFTPIKHGTTAWDLLNGLI